MDRADLAARLTTADDAKRAALLEDYAWLADAGLAQALKTIYLDSNSSEPARAARAAAALSALAGVTDDPEVRALAAWTNGMAALQLAGQAEQAIGLIDEAAARFEALGQPQLAAATQISKVYALAVLGRYEQAIECGLRAHAVFLAHGDLLAAGKIEQNLGNIYHRRDQYSEAERCYRAAREHFAAAGDRKLLAYADNGLANLLALQHNFRDAAQLYQQALTRARAEGLEVTQAEIECNLGCLALFQGRYDQVLTYLEQARRRYTLLEMPHRAAITEQELADAYLELNLASEAVAIYARVIPILAERGMRAEQARALTYYGRAQLLLGQHDQARDLLAEAHRLYAGEGNTVGAAMVTLIEAQLHYAKRDYAAAIVAAALAEDALAASGTWTWALRARWLRGEAARALGQTHAARALLESTLRDAEHQAVPQLAQRCHTSLGLLALKVGDNVGAEAAFKRSVALIEDLRAPLPAEEFRTAFISDKLTPYAELVRLCLADGCADRTIEAFGYAERQRSRALLDLVGGALRLSLKPRDSYEARLLRREEEAREALNWFYNQINRAPENAASRSTTAMESLHRALREHEARVLDITRQLQQHVERPLIHTQALDLGQLQRSLGRETALVEYFSLDGELLAFVLTDERIEVVRQLGSEEQLEAALTQFRFQINALRYGSDRLQAHLGQLAARARHHLSVLYTMLLRPIEERLGARRLVVVPYRAVHYVPFHALYDGTSYLIERREVCYAPSATVLQHCLAHPQRPLRRALLMGVPDSWTPRVRDEVNTLAPLFPQAVSLLDQEATLMALREQGPGSDILHLACHGHFRPDNPLFSSLQLADEWLTVRDTYSLDLDCQLAVLSACETGVSALAPGDELIGLARGFLSASVPSLLVSLWTVDDESTATLMTCFYERLSHGERPAAALRYAQCELMREYPHPFFWSPFMLIGRW